MAAGTAATRRDDHGQHGQDHHGTPADRHDSTSSHSRSDVRGSTWRGERSRSRSTPVRGQLLLAVRKFRCDCDWFRLGTIRDHSPGPSRVCFPISSRIGSLDGRAIALADSRVTRVETFGTLSDMTAPRSRTEGPTPATNHDDSPDRRTDRRLGADRVQGHQRTRRTWRPRRAAGSRPRSATRTIERPQGTDPPVAPPRGDLP